MTILPDQATVLLVEDDPNSYTLMLDLLKLAGVRQTYWRNTGVKALALAESLERVDLILLDLHLPGEDGFSVLRKIRAHDKLKHARVVAVTASVNTSDLIKCQNAGFDSFIGKPVNPVRLPMQVKQLLAGESFWW